MIPVFPIALFGSIAYFQEIANYSSVYLAINETFPKQTFRNRYVIRNSQGILKLTVPVNKPAGSKTLTKDILVSKELDWRRNHWKALEASYAASPYFDHYASEIHAMIFDLETDLVQFCLKTTQFILKQWQVNCEINLSTSFENEKLSALINFDFENVKQIQFTEYQQVMFLKNEPFIENTSVLDLLFCLGPLGRNIIFSSNR